MRTSKIITLLLIALPACSFTQEETLTTDVTPSIEQAEPEKEAGQTESSQDTPNAPIVESTGSKTIANTEDTTASAATSNATTTDETTTAGSGIEKTTPESIVDTQDTTAAENVSIEPEEIKSDEPQAFEIPAIPEPTIDEELNIPDEVVPQSPVGIDTVSLEDPQGNWLFKRIWWERAEERYEKIRALVDAIWESRTIFFNTRNELDRNVLDPFYISVGVRQGELQVILTELNETLEKQREEQGSLNEQERELYAKHSEEQENLRQLKIDVDSIGNLDHAIDDALGTLMEQINRVRSLEKQAWDNFKEIAHVLNDTKARELYYMIEGSARNIKHISNYIEQDFLTHFTRIVNEAAAHAARVLTQIQALKEKGITFKRQSEQLEAQKEEERKRAEEAEAEQEEEEDKPKPKTGLFQWVISKIQSAINFVISLFTIPYNMIFGSR